ncbi:TonB-dependent receptor [Sphingomonas sp. RHCKR7]|uniref:TonB-dependent receptor n=1 Tax=Sphingomonas folli TaxID=2862497 RepID=UPI001C68693F|nr:TonB-dependent receptor [Sphingomonas folli]MBW6528630.1 TonB-dependent receptor [Sphingomonas folli]
MTLSAMCLSLLGSPARARQVETAPPGGAPDSDIVVTGEKIDRSLKETSTAVTVITAVDPQVYKSPYDVAAAVPNMIATAADLPSIRGVSGSGPASGIFTLMSGARPRVATIVDGVAETFAGQRYADAGMWDIAQVEVLRGPQSTTTGRNSLGGAIVLTTKGPTWDWQSALRAGAETERGTGILAAMVSGPVVTDQLAIRLTADGTRGRSYIRYDAGSGFPFDPARVERTNLRGKMLWAPAALPGLTALVTATKRWNKGEYLYSATGPDVFRYRWDNPMLNTRTSDSTVGTVAVDLAYAFGEGVRAHLLYGHGWFDARFRQSNQNSDARSRGQLDLAEGNNSAEARLTYAPEGSRVSGVVGLYHYDRHQALRSDLGVNGPDDIDTDAAYVDAALGLAGHLDLLAGGRVERETQRRDVALSWGAVRGRQTRTMALPKLGLRYAVTASTNVSATMRKGYSPGGGAIDWVTGDYYVFGRETVWTYEIGSRTELAGRRLSLGSSLFLNDYRGFQTLIAQTFTNLPRARTYGLELETGWRPWTGLDLHAALGLLDSDIRVAPAGLAALRGRRLDNAPSFTGALAVDQHFRGGLALGAGMNRVSRYSSQVESGTAIDGGDYTVLDAHIGYEATDFGVRAYVRNAGDARILYAARTNHFGDLQGQVGQPRTIGVTVDMRW